jgi:hypothetical protein
MNENTKRIKKTVDGLSPVLRQDGFVRHSLNFSRTAGEALQVINIQLNRYNSNESGSFTMNIGVYFERIAKLLPGTFPMPANPKEPNCIVRTRVGTLMPNATDFWWTVTPQTDVTALAKEVGTAYSKYAIPWLARLETVSALATTKPGKHEVRHAWTAAAAMVVLGDRAKATQLVEAELEWLKVDPLYAQRENEKLREQRLEQLRTWAREQGIAVANERI